MHLCPKSSGRRIIRSKGIVQDIFDTWVHKLHVILHFGSTHVVGELIQCIHECGVLTDHSRWYISYFADLYCLALFDTIPVSNHHRFHAEDTIIPAVFSCMQMLHSQLGDDERQGILEDTYSPGLFSRPHFWLCRLNWRLLDWPLRRMDTHHARALVLDIFGHGSRQLSALSFKLVVQRKDGHLTWLRKM